MSQYQNLDKRVPIALDNVSLVQDLDKCKNCTLCRRACVNDAGVMDFYDLTTNGDRPICINCGQCAVACPFDCINERSEISEVKKAIMDPQSVVVFQTAPAIRVGLGEEFGMEYGSFVEGKVITALRQLGADYVLDTNFGADMTIMEEASELIERLTSSNHPLPQLTSCCPAWVKFVETFYPELIPHLSSAKSPILMAAATQKTYFAKKHQIDPSKMVTVCVTPCTAKKAEIRRPEMNSSAQYWNQENLRDGDLCITVRELAKWIREEEIDFVNLEEGSFDRVMGEASGGGVIFGNTGGVMESAMRSAYKFMTNENAPLSLIPFKEIRGLQGVKEADVQIGKHTLHVAAISGTGNFRKFYLEMKESGKHYDFIEVMACPGGCIGGGGMPRVKMPKVMAAKQARIDSLYKRDGEVVIKTAQDNSEIQNMYNEFFGVPLSEQSHQLLHTEGFMDRSSDLGPNGACTPETCPTSIANLKKAALAAKQKEHGEKT